MQYLELQYRSVHIDVHRKVEQFVRPSNLRYVRTLHSCVSRPMIVKVKQPARLVMTAYEWSAAERP